MYYNEFKNSNGIISSNELSLLIFSSNKDTNKYKRDALFGNLLSISKEKDKIKINSSVNNSIENSFKNMSIYNYLENNIKENHGNLNNFLFSEKNKIKNIESQIKQLSTKRNNNYNTEIKKDYTNLFENENNYSLNDYLNLNQNSDNNNAENNFLNSGSPQKSLTPPNNNLQSEQYSSNINKNLSPNQKINKNIKLEAKTEERKKGNKNKVKVILNEELFNTRIKEKISKIKEDIINNNNLKSKNENGKNKKNNRYMKTKLKVDQNIDYYEIMVKNLNQRDEAKELENIFSEFFTEIKYKYWMKNSYKEFIYSLNNCQIYSLIKFNKDKNSYCFDELISNMELSNNKNISNSNSYIYNSKSELLREGSHSINDSHSSQILENQIEKNIPIISKFPKLVIPQSIIPEESSNFLYSNNDYALNRSFGEPIEENNNMMTNLMEVQELEEEKNILYEENIKKELFNIGNNEEIDIRKIFDNLNANNIFDEEKQIDEEDIIKEYKSKIFYDILLIAQNNNINVSQKNPFGKITKSV